jgi:putative FmdB family regulatory protein
MPIYEYRCPKCKEEKEIILSIQDSDSPQRCNCGELMIRKVSLPQPAIFVVTNRERLVGTLNDEEGGYQFSGAGKHGKRYKSVIGKSLENPKPVIGRGF